MLQSATGATHSSPTLISAVAAGEVAAWVSHGRRIRLRLPAASPTASGAVAWEEIRNMRTRKRGKREERQEQGGQIDRLLLLSVSAH